MSLEKTRYEVPIRDSEDVFWLERMGIDHALNATTMSVYLFNKTDYLFVSDRLSEFYDLVDSRVKRGVSCPYIPVHFFFGGCGEQE